MIKYAFLGIVQGLTEFFPVSSSGHLVFLQHVLGIRGEELVLTLVLHLGTLLAVIIYLRREIVRLFSDRRLAMLVLLTTFVTGIVGIAGRRMFEELFKNPGIVAAGLGFSGIVLLATKRLARLAQRETLRLRDSVFVGIAQAVAIVPGVSRSGITISSLLSRRIDPRLCFTFSFLISVPAVIGASLIEMKDIKTVAAADLSGLALGFACSLAAGICALFLLKKILVRDKFHYFGYYCLALSAVMAAALYIR